jgi:WD40 repeat protein
VKLWDWRTGRVIRRFLGHRGHVSSLAFRPPDGRFFASVGADQAVTLWDVTTGRVVFRRRRPPGDYYAGMAYAVAFSPDAQLLASASRDRTVRVWDLSHSEKKKLKQ